MIASASDLGPSAIPPVATGVAINARHLDGTVTTPGLRCPQFVDRPHYLKAKPNAFADELGVLRSGIRAAR